MLPISKGDLYSKETLSVMSCILTNWGGKLNFFMLLRNSFRMVTEGSLGK